MVLEHPPKGKKMDDNWGFAHGLENLHISNLHYIYTHIYIYTAPTTNFLDIGGTCVSHRHGLFGIMDDPLVVRP